MYQDDIYNDLFIEFEKYYPCIASQTERWYPSGQYEITVILEDGTKILYDSIDKTFQNISFREREGYVMNEDVCRREFSYKLRDQMLVQGVTQHELAEVSGVSRISISNYLNRKNTASLYTAYRLAKALGCDLRDLITF